LKKSGEKNVPKRKEAEPKRGPHKMGREQSERILWGKGAAEADSGATREVGTRSDRTQASDASGEKNVPKR